MSSSDFFTRLERELVDAAERDVAVSPARRRFAALTDRLRPRRVVTALPVAAALLVGVIAAVVLSLGGEQPRTEAGRGPLAEPTDGLTVEPLGTAPQGGTAVPLPVPPPRPGSAPNPAVPLPSVPDTPRPIPTGPSVFLLNGTTEPGLAVRSARRLSELGTLVVGTGNADENTVSNSIVYAQPRSRGDAVAQQLGIGLRGASIPREVLRQFAQGADVVVLLGADRLELKDRQVKLSGESGASGVALLGRDGGLALTGSGLPPSKRYFLWGETPKLDPVPIGFAQYDKRQRRVAGSIPVLPPRLAVNPVTRVFLTREKTEQPKRPGEIVLDSGRIPG